MPDAGQIVTGFLVIMAVCIVGGYLFTVFVVARQPPERQSNKGEDEYPPVDTVIH